MKKINDLSPIQHKQLINSVACVLQRSALDGTPTENIVQELTDYFAAIEIDAPIELVTYSELDNCYNENLTVNIEKLTQLIENAAYLQWWSNLPEHEQYNLQYEAGEVMRDYYDSL